MEAGAPVPSGDPDPGASRRRFDLWVCLLLGLVCMLVYNANMRLITASDNYPARYLPFAILGYHTLHLDPVYSVAAQGRTRPYWMVLGRDGHLVSQYPVVTPLLVSPLYLPAIAYLHLRGWTDSRVNRLARLMEKVSASLVASLSVALMYLLLRRRVDVRAALLVAVAYAFGTNTWVIGSQGLWQHGMGELLLVITLLLVTGPCTAIRALAAGAVCVLVAFNRPPDGIMALPLGLYSLCWARRRALLVVAGTLAPAALLGWYNIGVVGSLLGGYAIVQQVDFFRFSIPAGVAGLLFSLGRGLFVFTPFLLALPLGLRRAFRDREGRPLSILICIMFVAQVSLYAKADWRGGCSWGPRYLTDVLPLLAWMLAPVVAGMGGVTLAAFCSAAGASMAVQAVGAFWYTGKSDEALKVTSANPVYMNAVWNLRSTPFILEFRHPRAPRDLLMKIDGGVDGVAAGGTDVTGTYVGTEIVVHGWALTNHRTPARVLASLVPGGAMVWNPAVPDSSGSATVFLRREQADQAPGTSALSGWRITLRTGGLAPGDYVIETYVQANEGGEFHPLGQRAFTVTAGAGGQ